MRTQTPVTSILSKTFRSAISQAYPELNDNFQVSLAPSKTLKHGHYQCNNAMELKKKLGVKNPREVAQKILEQIDNSSIIQKAEVAGPGFINIHLSTDWMSKNVKNIVTEGVLPPELKYRKVAIDFSSPNIAKNMHVGHLRSTIIGETLSRTFEFVGYDVDRINHVGDWGTQFGMLIAYLKEQYPNFLQEVPDISDLNGFYKQAKVKFDQDEDFKARAHSEVVSLQAGEENNMSAWRLLCDISRKEFQKIYDRLDVKINEVGESFYNPFIPQVIEELKQKGIAEESDGALCIFVEGHDHPLIIKKSDGGYGYGSTDMAAIWYRIHQLKSTWLVYVVDSGQSTHFDMVFKAAKRAGWVSDDIRINHVGFGVVLGEDNKRLKSRSGDTVKLVDLLDEARDRTYKSIKERAQDAEDNEYNTGVNLSEEEMREASETIGYAAVKYADLKSNRLSNYIFSFDRMLDLKGNTAVYLLYAHARIASISSKAGVDIDTIKEHTPIELDHVSEQRLALHLLKFPEIISSAIDELLPNRICEYLYGLASIFNDFFRDCRVIGTEQQNSRLLLCEATALTMRQCFNLLGMKYLMRI
eukprot:gb/GECH01013841.1/.p1 GENE.gb/GECH01013841.1/~~gb/GECH01013841.1/.p1  ORF type:complete len:585 (+),score=147.40 gb/GECH01013841.1/:1-1755(+)